jgi:NAD(P)-dependent dehydrogenase (short-subunit alcohol dehydrogenase family)
LNVVVPSGLTGRLLEGQRIVVTGAARPEGIGFSSAMVMAQHGARVALLDLDADICAARAAELGPQHIGGACDIRDPQACRDAIGRVVSAFGGIDVLVNNAGRAKQGAIADISVEDFDWVMETNVRGGFVLSQAALPHFRANGKGNIIFMSSTAGQRGGGGFGSTHYAIAKAAVIGMTKAMARELGPDKIRVNAVAPNLIDNGAAAMPRERRAEFEKSVPMLRSGSSWDVAGAILFLASDLSQYCTGATIDVNGGIYMR